MSCTSGALLPASYPCPLPPLRPPQPFQTHPFRLPLNLSNKNRSSITKLSLSPFHFPLSLDDTTGGSNNNNNNNNNGSNNNNNPSEGDGNDYNTPLVYVLFLSSSLLFYFTASALARTIPSPHNGEDSFTVWEVRGLSKWTRLLPDPSKDEFVPSSPPSPNPGSGPYGNSPQVLLEKLWSECGSLIAHLMLPDGFPNSVTPDYLGYSLWRGVQGVASQISGVLATQHSSSFPLSEQSANIRTGEELFQKNNKQALLYAVGLGKGAIPAAAAVNWVLKDGIGYLSKIMLSKYGRHFDVNPKGWRLFADLLENAAFGLEMLTPTFPHLFVSIGAVAGASRSAATLIQAATRSCFYAGFAAQRNFAEVIAKGEAQGMVSKFVGILLGIALANCIGSSTPLALASFGVLTWIHMFCNLKSYQCIQIRTLNPYRASLIFSEYLLSGQAPAVKEVNDEEPLFPAVPFLHVATNDRAQSVLLSPEASMAAAEIDQCLQLGSKLSDLVNHKEDVIALFNLYKDEGYMLIPHKRKFCVVLKEGCSPQDLLKSLFQVNYLYWLERNARIDARSVYDDCKVGGRLQLSLDYVQREFDHVKNDCVSMGWVADGLIARPLPNRIRLS